MKRTFTTILAFAFILGTSVISFAQKDAKAKQVLDKMSNKYKSYDAFQADLMQEAVSTTEGTLGSMQIDVLVHGDKYVLKAEGQEIYNNGETIWRFVPEINEVSIEEPDPSSEDLLDSPSKIYTVYKKGFKYLYAGNENVQGQNCHVVDLSPDKDKEYNFFKLTMYISSKDHSLLKWVIYENGNTTKYVYNVHNFRPDVAVTEKDFIFDVESKEDLEVVDLR